MRFNSTPKSLSPDVINVARQRFTALTLELGVRKNNEHVGSGLGGNNFQLMVLLGLKHHLINSSSVEMRVSEGAVSWSVDFLTKNRMRYIRGKLDEMFTVIQEKNKTIALAMESIIGPNAEFFRTFNEHSASFSSLIDLFSGKEYTHDHRMNNYDALLMANLMTGKLASDLDRGDERLIGPVGRALSNFSMEIVLLTVRRNIQIERLVRYNVDEHPDWENLLNRINKAVDA
jgi:hypothetical protein